MKKNMKKKIIISILLIINIVIITVLIVDVVILKNKKNEESNKLSLYNINYNLENGNIYNEKREKILDYSYSIYFYDIEDVKFEYRDYKIDLKNDLKYGYISPEQLIVQAEEDAKEKKNWKRICMDGGSTIYIYENFSILKMNSLNGNRDLYIGPPNMDINEIE